MKLTDKQILARALKVRQLLTAGVKPEAKPKRKPSKHRSVWFPSFLRGGKCSPK